VPSYLYWIKVLLLRRWKKYYLPAPKVLLEAT
jgi:hypothetical protein